MYSYSQEYQNWLGSSLLSEDEKAELLSIAENDNEIKERFYTSLEFGTAGLRGKMRLGTNAMNRFTVAQATQGLANLIIKEGRSADGVAIAYDSRNNSELFAKVSASVLAANGIKAYIFDELRPTPELSFALRELKCVAGIILTIPKNITVIKHTGKMELSSHQSTLKLFQVKLKKSIFSLTLNMQILMRLLKTVA